MAITGQVKTIYEDAEKTKAVFPRTVPSAISGLIDLIYPVGSIYMSVNNANPSVLFGGTWEQIQDRFLLASGSTYSAGSTGGEASHTLTEYEMPLHNHDVATDSNPDYVWTVEGANYTGKVNKTGIYASSNEIAYGYRVATTYNGGNQPHNNMPPYIAVYVWKRTA